MADSDMLAPLLVAESVLGRRWELCDCDERVVLAIAQRCGVSDVVARMLAGRGVTQETAEGFLNPTLRAEMPDPSQFKDMDAAAERIAAAVTAGEKIAIFGDYDVDGATSSALIMRYLRAAGSDPIVYIPDRMKEGYGPNKSAMLALKERGASVIITVDCGTMAFEPLQAAREAGVDVIVVDHHQSEARLPEAFAIVNPNRIDESRGFGQLAAVGVAFLLLVAVNRRLREAGFFAARPEPDLRQWLDIVALGTVCDVVPLTGLNRAFVAQGIKVLARRENQGLRALADVAGLAEMPEAYHLGFLLGPRINAGGRVGECDLGVRLLTTEDDEEARSLAATLDRHNQQRKAIESLVLEDAMAQAAQADPQAPMLLVHAKQWHPGVIGIVAGRLKDHYHKPCAVVAMDEGIGKASARSVAGVDIGVQVVAAVQAGLLLGGGGHAMAAGFTVEEGKLEALKAFFWERMESGVASHGGMRPLVLDGHVSPQGMNVALVRQIEQMGPFGQGNPSARMAIVGARVVRAEPVGDGHVRLICVDAVSGKGRFKGVAFRAGGNALGQALLCATGRVLHLAGTARINCWQGVESVDFHIEDAALA